MSNATLILLGKTCYNCGRKMERLPESIQERDSEKTYAMRLDAYGDLYCNFCTSPDVTEFDDVEFGENYAWDYPVNPINPRHSQGYYFKFVHKETSQDGLLRSEYGNNQDWTLGRKQVVDGTPKLCTNGFHASSHMFDAHANVTTEWMFLVKLEGAYHDGESKICALECTPIKLLHLDGEFARSVILHLLANWNEDLGEYTKEHYQNQSREGAYPTMYTIRNMRGNLSPIHHDWFDTSLMAVLDTMEEYDANSPREIRIRLKAQMAMLLGTMDFVKNDVMYHRQQLEECEKKLTELTDTVRTVIEDLEKI